MCGLLPSMTVATKFVFLTHPHEYKKVKVGTGRLTSVSLADSEIHVGIAFDGHPAVMALRHDPRYRPMLLYPGPTARNLSEGTLSEAEMDAGSSWCFCSTHRGRSQKRCSDSRPPDLPST